MTRYRAIRLRGLRGDQRFLADSQLIATHLRMIAVVVASACGDRYKNEDLMPPELTSPAETGAT